MTTLAPSRPFRDFHYGPRNLRPGREIAGTRPGNGRSAPLRARPRARVGAREGTYPIHPGSGGTSKEVGVSGRGITLAMLRGPDGRRRPTSLRRRIEQIRAAAAGRWQEAGGDDLKRLAAATDYARSAAACASDRGEGMVDPAAQIQAATKLLWSVGDTLTRQLADLDDARQGEAHDAV